MVQSYALYLLISLLEDYLPLDQIQFIKECVNTKKWGMGDLCFPCQKSFKKINGLILPKKTKLYDIAIKRKIYRLPLCSSCNLFCRPNSLFNHHMHSVDYPSLRYGIEENEVWDPVKKYDAIVRRGRGFKIDETSRIDNGLLYLDTDGGFINLKVSFIATFPEMVMLIKDFGYEIIRSYEGLYPIIIKNSLEDNSIFSRFFNVTI